MTYRDHPPAQSRPRPLVDLIPNHRDDLDVSDEEDGFYGPDDDFLTPLKWQTAVTRTTDRIPRRIARNPRVSTAFTLILCIAWFTFLGPRYSAYRLQQRLMDSTPAMSYGSNLRPDFKGMIQVSDMDEEHLPATHKHKRLVFIGDVHGCRKELEHLLKKVDFDYKRDHLVLTGDMIAKGPDSAGVIKVAQKIGASCVRGNWEDKLLLSIAEAQQRGVDEEMSTPDAPLDQLNAHTVDKASLAHSDYKLRKLAKEFSKKEVAYMAQCPVILRVGTVPALGSMVAVHAGLVPDIPLERQDPFHAMNMRTIDLKTRIPSSKHAGTPWEKFWNHRQKKLKEKDRTTVVYGHNRKRGLNVQEYTYGLDSGCVSGGKLTALVVNGHGKTELVQVKCDKAEGYDKE